MGTRAALRELLAQEELTTLRPHSCFLGFDGFTDEIIQVVDQRQDAQNYQAMESIAALGQRISAAAGKSCNLELVPITQKIGGNGPIMAMALASLGQEVSYAGAIGANEQVEAVFQPMESACKALFPLCPSGYSQAMEFRDGKVILGKHQALIDLNSQEIFSAIGEKELLELLEHSELFASLNWTMLPHTSELWQRLLQELVPQLSSQQRFFFVDLADPAKRSDAALAEAMDLLGEWSRSYDVILGINVAEAQRLIQLKGISLTGSEAGALQEAASQLRSALGISQLLIHSHHFAIVDSETGTHCQSTWFCEKPLISTGAGDNFNAGYCHGLLTGLKPEHALLMGMATAGHYIRSGESPSHAQTVKFLKSWEKQLEADQEVEYDSSLN